MSRVLRNKILLVGTGLLDFVKGIYKSSELEFPQSRVDDELKRSNGVHSGIIIPWTIKTKYYTATVDFWLDEIQGDDKTEVIKGYADPGNGVGDVVDAFVYVFRKDKPDTFQGIKEWLSFVEKHEPSILMCAGLPSGKDNLELSDVEDWCLDNQFEYVDLDENTVEPLDKAGWDLAVDILQTNLWDGMTEHNATGQKSKRQENEEDEELMRELRQLKLENQQEDEELDLPSQDEVKEMQTVLFGGLDDEDGLEKAFETMQSLREQGKDLNDEERRKLAAKVALSFAAQLGI